VPRHHVDYCWRRRGLSGCCASIVLDGGTGLYSGGDEGMGDNLCGVGDPGNVGR
jgi:hypothetical protein